MPDLHGRLTPQGNLDGTLHTIVYANNYNSLDNKPSINSVTLQGNKTASELGLAVPADITVTSVNGETGAVVLDGTDINYDANTTVNSKLDDLQSQIDNSGVLAVNGKTGVVTLTGSDINYSAGVTLNSKIDAVEAEIPTVSYPVTSVNTKTGAVVLDGTDIKYDTNTTINAKIDAVEAEIPTVDYPVTSVNGETGTVVLDGTDINYDTNTTINAKIDAVMGSIPTTDNDISHYTGTPTPNSTAEAIGNCATKSYVDNGTTPTVTITSSRTDVTNWNVVSTPITRGGAVNIQMIFEMTGTAQPSYTHTISCSRTIKSLTITAINITTGAHTAVGTYDSGNIKWNAGIRQGVHYCVGTLLFE